MHRNSAIIIAILAILAAFLIGVNINRRLHPEENSPQPSAISYQTPNPSPSSANFELRTSNLAYCGLSFAYPGSFTITSASDSAQLINNETSEQISIGCAQEIPQIPLPEDKIEDATISGQPAKLYHDASAKDGSPKDVVIFTNPQNQLQVALFGYGKNFEELLKTVKLSL